MGVADCGAVNGVEVGGVGCKPALGGGLWAKAWPLRIMDAAIVAAAA